MAVFPLTVLPVMLLSTVSLPSPATVTNRPANNYFLAGKEDLELESCWQKSRFFLPFFTGAPF